MDDMISFTVDMSRIMLMWLLSRCVHVPCTLTCTVTSSVRYDVPNSVFILKKMQDLISTRKFAFYIGFFIVYLYGVRDDLYLKIA